MKQFAKVLWVSMFVLAFLLLTLQGAYAYVDPGTGSYFFQLLIGALLGAAVSIKLFWRRIWSFITRRRTGSGVSSGD